MPCRYEQYHALALEVLLRSIRRITARRRAAFSVFQIGARPHPAFGFATLVIPLVTFLIVRSLLSAQPFDNTLRAMRHQVWVPCAAGRLT